MITKEYKQIIKASSAEVWLQLFNPSSYTVWTAAFSHGSYTKGELLQNNEVHYLDTNGNGIASLIKECVINERLIIEHHYEIKNLVVDTAKHDWYGMLESYTLNKISENETELIASLNTTEAFMSYFDEMFPIALANIVWLCEKNIISIEANINAPMEKVWNYYTEPQHIMQWNQASPDWHCPQASAQLNVGGKFSSTMAAKDGSISFDFWGTYTHVEAHKNLAYTMGDNRAAKIMFIEHADKVRVIISFEPETQNPIAMQKAGWQAILNSFKNYTEQ